MKVMRVAAAVLPNRNGNGTVLVGQRRKNDTSAFKWEFPGGKLREGESFEEAVVREIDEELGMRIEVLRTLHRVDYAYSDEHLVHIEFMLCRCLDDAEAERRVHEALRWVRLEDLPGYDFLAANAPFVKALADGKISVETG